MYGLEWLAFDGGGAWTENPILMAGTIMAQSKFGAAGTLINLAGTYTQEEPPAGSSINAALAFRSAVAFQQAPAARSVLPGRQFLYRRQFEPGRSMGLYRTVQSLAPDTSKA